MSRVAKHIVVGLVTATTIATPVLLTTPAFAVANEVSVRGEVNGFVSVLGSAIGDNIFVDREANKVVIKTNHAVSVTNNGISGSIQCKVSPTNLTDAECVGNVTNISLRGGNGDDSFDVESQSKLPVTFKLNMQGDAGNDQLIGGESDDLINGGEGNDKLEGNGGADKIFPGSESGTSPLYRDFVRGGAGFDTVDYGVHRAGVVTRDDHANDGAPGEKDDIGSDIENVVGVNIQWIS